MLSIYTSDISFISSDDLLNKCGAKNALDWDDSYRFEFTEMLSIVGLISSIGGGWFKWSTVGTRIPFCVKAFSVLSG